jgi:hypothetical protein
VCAVQFTVTAWQATLSKSAAGFQHSQTFVLEVSLGAVVLNEILPNPETANGEREFIELYNFSGLPVNVAGWNIAERTAANTVVNHFISGASTGAAADLVALDGSLETIIEPGGFLALRYRGNSTYLNIVGDTVTLIETPTGLVLDEFTYVNAPRSDSFSRIPDGFGPWVVASSTADATNGVLPLTPVRFEASLALVAETESMSGLSDESALPPTDEDVLKVTEDDAVLTLDTDQALPAVDALTSSSSETLLEGDTVSESESLTPADDESSPETESEDASSSTIEEQTSIQADEVVNDDEIDFTAVTPEIDTIVDVTGMKPEDPPVEAEEESALPDGA